MCSLLLHLDVAFSCLPLLFPSAVFVFFIDLLIDFSLDLDASKATFFALILSLQISIPKI